VIRYFCNRIAVIYCGEIVEIGDADEIFFKPRQAYTQALLAAVPESDPRRHSLLHAA
jgi:ABC-type oligopeptide transport system ATPase subunit